METNKNILTIYLLCLFAFTVHGIRFHLQPNTQKCFRDDVQAHQLIVISLEISDAPGQQIDYVVSDIDCNLHIMQFVHLIKISG